MENLQTKSEKQYYIPMEVNEASKDIFIANGYDLSTDAVWTKIGHRTVRAIMIPATKELDCQHFFRQIFLGYFSDIVQAFDTLRKNVCGDDYTSLHNPIVLSSVLPAYGMFHSIQILFL